MKKKNKKSCLKKNSNQNIQFKKKFKTNKLKKNYF